MKRSRVVLLLLAAALMATTILIGVAPMPQSGYLHGDDAWALVHFVRSLSSDEQRARMEMKRFRIVARRVAELPAHPDSGIWRTAPAVNLHLMPLWWRAERPEEVTVQALHDGKQIAFRLVWTDSTYDATAMRPQDFRDAAAIEFALTADPPFFAMGGAGEHAGAVNIWMWKAERQADLDPAFQDLEKVYPNIGIDSYPNLLRSPVEQPMRHALTLESDPRFVTAWGAGNIVADPTRRSAAEDLTARGFGTLRARPRIDQSVQSVGEYDNLVRERYRIVWAATIDGRLVRRRLLPSSVRERRLQEFARAFPMLADSMELEFRRWFDASHPSHDQILAFAQTPALNL